MSTLPARPLPDAEFVAGALPPARRSFSRSAPEHTGRRLAALSLAATLLGYRLWRRSRYGPARPADLKAEEACAVLEPARR